MEKRPLKIQALIDFPDGGNVRKGEIGTISKDKSTYNFPSQNNYWVINTFKYIILDENHIDEVHYEIY